MRFFISILFFSSLVFGQTKVDSENFDFDLLEEMVIEKVNEERSSRGLSILKLDRKLGKAAANHSIYQAKKKRMTHNQTSGKNKTVSERVKNTGAKFEMISENVAFTDAFGEVEMKVGRKKQIFKADTYQGLADIFFMGWKNSKPHLGAIINKNFTHTGISFCFDNQKKRLYATQVFGKK